MDIFNDQMKSLLLLELCRQMTSGEQISMLKYNALTTILINNNIPFDVAFTSETRKSSAALQLTIYINPTVSVVLNITVGNGGNATFGNIPNSSPGSGDTVQ